MATTEEEKNRLFKQLRFSLGAPIRNIELEDDQLCVLLELAIEDYAQYVQEWFIENQWTSVYGKNVTTQDITFALSVRSLDLATEYSYAYSKQVGLQARGPWELKKDFIEIEAGRQVYTIPAGREVNQVLYITPSAIDHALYGVAGSIDHGFGGGVAQLGSNHGTGGFGGVGNGGHYITPAFDVLLGAADIDLKHRMIRSELAYKITKGPGDTKLLHLLSTPGSNFNFGSIGRTGTGGAYGLTGCKVWYHYYDTTAENVEECREQNKDIIQLPNNVPLARLDYSEFNEPTKTLVRQLFFALAKKTLGRVRGKYGGKIGVPEAEGTLDYESLLAEGVEEEKALKERLEERLRRLSSEVQLERMANEAENLNKTLKFVPLGFYKF